MNSKIHTQEAIEAIKKKLVGEELSYREIFTIMDEISRNRLSPVLTTYFAAAGLSEGFTDEELYFLTKAMVETGPKLKFSGIVADKHSTGGVAGTRTTMIVVPIIAAAGFKIPKTSSRAITSPAGTADTMEVLAPVEFDTHKMEHFVNTLGGCIISGGSVKLAPADDIIIQVEQPLSFESFDKIIVSVMAKKVAAGSTHVIMDIPVGPTMKIQHEKDAHVIARKFHLLAKRFDMKLVADVSPIIENAGKGVGPVLEAIDVLQVLEQRPERPIHLEERALRLAGKLLTLCLEDVRYKETRTGPELAREMLTSGKALAKMKEIIKAQGGDPDVGSTNLATGKWKFEFKSAHAGILAKMNNQHINIVCRVLGCPADKKAGMLLAHRIGENIHKGDILTTLYSSDRWRLEEAVHTLKNFPIYTIK